MSRNLFLLLVCTTPLLIGCSTKLQINNKSSIFDTRKEAEIAGEKFFDCFGAHKIGNKWAPCDQDEHGPTPDH